MSKRGENIYKRKDGRWEGRLLQEDGNYKYIYGKSYREVKNKKGCIQEEKDSKAEKSIIKKTQASTLFEDWIREDVSGKVKPSTFESYYYCVNKYIIPIFQKTGNDRITDQSIAQFLEIINCNESLAQSTKNKIITIFKIALEGALQKNGQKYIPEVTNAGKRFQRSSAPLEVFSVKEQYRIEQVIRQQGDIRALGVLICFYTGIRLGEVCALKWGNIDFDRGTMMIENSIVRTKNFQECNEKTKTKLEVNSPKSLSSLRSIPLPEFLLDQMKASRCADNTFVLSGKGKPIDPRTFQREFKMILKEAGVRDRKLHAIRHTFATRALEAGVDVKTLSELMGHANATITLRVYAHSLMEQKIVAINRIGEYCLRSINSKGCAVNSAVKSY